MKEYMTRNESIFSDAVDGKTFIEIGRMHGISNDRVSQIVRKMFRILANRGSKSCGIDYDIKKIRKNASYWNMKLEDYVRSKYPTMRKNQSYLFSSSDWWVLRKKLEPFVYFLNSVNDERESAKLFLSQNDERIMQK